MNKKDELLWKVLRATTNSPNDVWKETHYRRHDGVPKNLLSNAVVRYTVPIKKVIDIKDDEIYLVVQFCTDEPDFPYFVIDKNAFTNNLKASQEYVYAINVRLCFKSEFKIRHRNQLDMSGAVKKEYRANILNDAISIIREKPRHSIMKLMGNAYKYKNFYREQFEETIYSIQYDKNEKKFKGI